MLENIITPTEVFYAAQIRAVANIKIQMGYAPSLQ